MEGDKDKYLSANKLVEEDSSENGLEEEVQKSNFKLANHDAKNLPFKDENNMSEEKDINGVENHAFNSESTDSFLKIKQEICDVSYDSDANTNCLKSKNEVLQSNHDDIDKRSAQSEIISSDPEERDHCHAFLLDTLKRACNEIYYQCLNKSDSYFCQDIIKQLQNTTYEFVSLREWLKLKNVVKELPLPERNNSLPLLNYDSLDAIKNQISNNNVSGDVSNEISKSQNSSSINVCAPDFVPASALSETMCDSNIQISRDSPSVGNDNFDLNLPNQSSNNCNNYSGSPYFENPGEYELPNYTAFYDSQQNQFSSLYPYSNYQQTVPTQYISPFHLPYPFFSTKDYHSNVTHPYYCYHGRSFRKLPRSRNFPSGDKPFRNKSSKYNNQTYSKHEETVVTEVLQRPASLSALDKRIDDVKLDIASNDKIVSLQNNKDSNQHENQRSSCWTRSSNPIEDQKLIKNNVFGMAEDECLLHFPELSSDCKKKSKSKWSALGTSKILFEPKGVSKIENGTKFTSPKVSTNKSLSFSEKTKSPSQTAERYQPSTNSTLKIKSTDVSGNSCSAPSTRPCIKQKLEDLSLETAMSLLQKEDDQTDSDGWEIVKTRSKWRENADAKAARQQSNKPSKLPLKTHRLQQEPNNHPFGSLLFQESNNSGNGIDVSLNSGDGRLISGIHQEHHSQALSVVTSELIFGSANSSIADNLSNEGWYSSETSHEVSINQSETTSPADSKCLEKIDPNEMYSAYMQYLSNVEQGSDDSEFKPAEKILHPESEGVKSCTPASLEEMTDFVKNDPIRALDFKNKLADKIRHQEDVKRKNEVKQQLALKKRMQFLHDKTAKFRGLVQKVKEVKAAQDQLALQRKNRLDQKLKKAEEKRKMHLNIIKRKAHDEEEKLKEIAFINELEAQNRRHDSLALRQEHEERLQCLVEERQRKLEEKAAKEAAVEERRKALEAERKEKLELLRERRRKKEEFIDRKQQEKEKERLVIAREKAREREERLQAIHIAQLANAEELQKRIQQKQEESHKRHIESIELIRQKAIEIGLHRNNADNSSNQIALYNRRVHLKRHEAHDKYKIHLKKRLKKIKSRMILSGSNFIEKTHNNCSKELVYKETVIQKLMKKLMMCELDKTFIWHNEDIESVDHYLDEILLYLQEEPSLCEELKNMKAFIFFESVINTFNYSSYGKVSGQSLRCIIKIITIYDLSCLESSEICLYILLSNILATLLDSLRFSVQALELPSPSWALIVELLLRFHSVVIDGLTELPDEMLRTIPDFSTRMKDLIGYILCSGLVNKLSDLFRQTIVDEKLSSEHLIYPSILFFKRLLCSWFISDELINALKSTDLLGTVPFLYESLIKHITDNDCLPDYCVPTMKLFLKLAEVDLTVFQEILGAENIALQWRGIASRLMTYCVSKNNLNNLLNMVIKLVGYFAIHNKKNQTLLQSGKQPTVLQQLVKLPFQYFCDPQYIELLYPTLISCSFNNPTNRAIVESEVSYSGLEKFMKSEKGQNNHIIKLLLESEEKSSQ